MPDPKPKRKAKPRKLIDPTKTSAAAKKIMDANATRSPLLRLTPELRNRIYGLVLGGHKIHIGRDFSGPVLHSICVAPPYRPGVDAQAITTSAESWQKGHPHNGCGIHAEGRPTHQPRMIFDWSLLGVCKQIHLEAALLPLMLNTFLCVRLDHLARFSDRLIVTQRPALTHLDLHLSSSRLLLSKTDQARLAKLTGLKSLKITFSVVVRYEETHEIERLQQLIDTIRGFCNFSGLKKVVVGFKAVDWGVDQRERLAQPVPMGYRDWARETEQQLLEG